MPPNYKNFEASLKLKKQYGKIKLKLVPVADHSDLSEELILYHQGSKTNKQINKLKKTASRNRNLLHSGLVYTEQAGDPESI